MPHVLFICTANYYRSRFCEHLFNHLSQQSLLNWTATSRGVVAALGTGNVGPISPYAVDALLDRGVPLPLTFRDPLQLTELDLTLAEIIIALDEDEHRPYMNITFPDWMDKVTYWHIGDLHVETPQKALALAEQNIRELIQQLSKQDRSGALEHLPILAQNAIKQP